MKKLSIVALVLLFPCLVRAQTFAKDLLAPGKAHQEQPNVFDTPYGRGTHAENYPPNGYSSLSLAPCNVSFKAQTATTTQTFTVVPLALWTPKSMQLVVSTPVYNFTPSLAFGAFTGVTAKNSASVSGSDLYLHKDKSFKVFGFSVTASGVLGLAEEFQAGQKGRGAVLVGVYATVK